MTLHERALRHQEKHIPADDLLAQARALQSKTLSLLLRADRASDLRTALSCVREARSTVELLSETLRQLTTAAACEPTQDAQDGV